MNNKRICSFVLVLVFIFLFRSAWICDDAFITFRTAGHCMQGYGLRFNIAERVQAYTHPLWLFCILAVHFFTREFYYTVLALNIAITLFAFYLLCFRIAKTEIHAVLAALLLVSSKAFMDYSTSGMENPLSHLLLAGFMYCFFTIVNDKERARPKKLFVLSLLSSMGCMNRFDAGLLYVPPLLYVCMNQCVAWKHDPGKNFLLQIFSLRNYNWTNAGYLFLGCTPFIAWELFAVFYYGFPFPNTAYAKLNTGIHWTETTAQGFSYLMDSLNRDPVTLFGIFSFITLTIAYYRKQTFMLLFGAGIILYLFYIVYIGGDFMSGRFLTLPLLGSVVLLSRISLDIKQDAILIFALIVVVNWPVFKEHVLQEKKPVIINQNGIADEKAFWSVSTGLLNQHRETKQIDNHEVQDARIARESVPKVYFRYSAGMFGFFAGPGAHVCDHCALCDSLLARLPAFGDGISWRVGHYKRFPPLGYSNALAGTGKIHDPSLRMYWEKLSILTRGPLLSLSRCKEIVLFNIGWYDRLLDEYCERNYNIHPYTDELAMPKVNGTQWNQKGNVILNQYGIGFLRPAGNPSKPTHYSVSLNCGFRYEIVFYRQGEILTRQDIDLRKANRQGLLTCEREIPSKAVNNHFDTVRIKPHKKAQYPSMGHFRLFSPDEPLQSQTVSLQHQQKNP